MYNIALIYIYKYKVKYYVVTTYYYKLNILGGF